LKGGEAEHTLCRLLSRSTMPLRRSFNITGAKARRLALVKLIIIILLALTE
jgi:hypothetical protein